MNPWLPHHGDTVDALLDDAIAACPDDLYLEFSGAEYTYAQVGERAARVAHLLSALGVVQGDRVVLLLDNGIDAVTTWFGINRIGAICVPVNTAYRGEFLRYQVADSGARVVIADASYVERVAAVADGLPELKTVLVRSDERPVAPPGGYDTLWLEEAAAATRSDLPAPVARPSDLSTLIYTSGTTGPSKGCMVSHNFSVNLARQYLEMTTRQPGEHAWNPLPLFHFNAWACCVLASALIKSSASIAPRFSVSGFWPEIERTGARVATLLGPMVSLLAKAPDNPAMQRANGQLRVVQSVPFIASEIAIWKKRFGVELAGANGFGLTEACLVTHLPLTAEAPPGSSGRVNDIFDVRIFDDEDNEVPPNVAGEVVVRPKKPHVMFEGYWNKPEATAALMRNLWFHTGDIGKFDDEGYFYFVDRKKDYLRRRGENVSSFEMERVFESHPQVLEVAVHAVLSEVSEDDVKVTAVLIDGATVTEEELCVWSIEHLPYFAVPRYIEFRDDLPRNPVGKVTKYVLRDEGCTTTTWDRENSDVQLEKR